MGFIGSHTVLEIVSEGLKCVIVDTMENSNKKCLERIN
jgi:UDP-glucose 4-epimerase